MRKIPKLSEVKQELARRDYLRFVQYCWVFKNKPLIVGKPTLEISNAITYSIDRFRRGESTTVVINVPPRHGKSDLVSRYLPPYFLGHFPDEDLMLVSHNFEKTVEFSRFSRNLLRSKPYKKLFPLISPDLNNFGSRTWGIMEDSEQAYGQSQYFGIQSGTSGAGAHLMVIDDYHSNRADAESQVIRNKVYDEFTDGIMTRLSPERHILFILATRWHKDDLVGRILEQNEIKIDRLIKLPAIDDDGEFLFPERFDPDFYDLMRRQQGRYGFSALYQQEPVLREGNIFEVDNIKVVEKCPFSCVMNTAWDIASSEGTGDYTVGVHGGMAVVNNEVHIYIDDIIRKQEKAPSRNRRIIETSIVRGKGPGIEGFGSGKDAYDVIKEELVRHSIWPKKLTPPKDKIIKAQPIEPVVEAGHFYIKKAPWNRKFIEEMRDFPGGVHDDQVDATALIYHMGKRIGAQGEHINF